MEAVWGKQRWKVEYSNIIGQHKFLNLTPIGPICTFCSSPAPAGQVRHSSHIQPYLLADLSAPVILERNAAQK